FRDLSLPKLHFSSKKPVDDGLYLSNGHIMESRHNERTPLMTVRDVKLPGLFNLENLMAALAGIRMICQTEPLPKTALAAGAAFEGVAHRLEVVATKAGVRYINDSIATTPESCVAALGAIKGDIHLIAGGYDKGIPLDRLAQAISGRVTTVFLIGETATKLEKALLDFAGSEKSPLPALFREKGLDQAVCKAAQIAREGSTVLLSPGFASYDQFLNFEERGECFRRYVAAL
ncbi:MAG: UDP-N-acetylmuramoyl-L-alanine--D-glutamate ligase, partial [Planctomycetes bacterium]|nr:UDP-N-acetylmuramoyl-L-alanine--D-glutamate ligase [Planctomycetota bacterium]